MAFNLFNPLASSRPTTLSIRGLKPNDRLDAAIDGHMMWENVEDAWNAGADIKRVSPGGATAWSGLDSLLEAWTDDSHRFWQGDDGDHKRRYLIEQSQRLLDAGVPIDGCCVARAVSGRNTSFLESVARASRRLGDGLDPVMKFLLEAGANPEREKSWHTAVEWCGGRDKQLPRADHPLKVWLEIKILNESLNHLEPASPTVARARL